MSPCTQRYEQPQNLRLVRSHRSLVGSQVRGEASRLDDVSATFAAMTNHRPYGQQIEPSTAENSVSIRFRKEATPGTCVSPASWRARAYRGRVAMQSATRLQ